MAKSMQEVRAQAAASAKPKTIHGMLERYKGEISRALPRHMTADRLARVALTECRKTPDLLKCQPESLFGAVIQAAQLGLEPGGALGHCYLIPFENRNRGTTEVQFIVGYRGMIDLARRSGQIVSLEAHAVYEGDDFQCAFGLNSDLKHVPDWQNANRADPGKLKFVYAVAKLKDGGVQFEVMSRAEVDVIRQRSRASRNGPWVTDYVAMALKTVIRRLFKYLPVSIELQLASNLDEAAEADLPQQNWENVIQGEAVEVKDDVEFQAERQEAEEAIPMQDPPMQDDLSAGTVDTETGEISPPSQAFADWQAAIEGFATKGEIARAVRELRGDARLSTDEHAELLRQIGERQSAL